MPTVAPLLRSIVHTTPRQLAWRLVRTVQRRLERIASLTRGPGVAIPADRSPGIAALAPASVFPPRTEQVTGAAQSRFLRFLSSNIPLTLPMQWHPPELAGIANLTKMHLHYMEWLEGLDDESAIAYMRDWIRANPPFAAGYWNGDWNSYAVSLRTVVWMQQIVDRGFDRSSNDVRTIAGSIVGQLRFLERHLELDLEGNHLLKNLKALLWGAAFFEPTPEASRWRQIASRRLAREIDEQILPDGVHFERSPAYHSQVLVDLVECLHVAPRGLLRDRLHAVVERAARALEDLTHPDGRVSLFNDGGLTMTYEPSRIAAAVAVIQGASPSSSRPIRLEDAGYYGLRSKDELILFDCGKIAPDHLPAHGHGDVLSFEWSVRGRRVITDTGVFEYLPGARRSHSRSTAAHNTVTVDDHDQAEFHGSFRVGRRPRVALVHARTTVDALDVEAFHDGYRHLPGRPIHRRRILARPGRIELHDRVERGSGQRAVSRLLLAPGFDVSVDPQGATIRGSEMCIRLTTDRPVATHEAPWWPDFGVEKPTIQLEIDLGTSPCSATVLLELQP